MTETKLLTLILVFFLISSMIIIPILAYSYTLEDSLDGVRDGRNALKDEHMSDSLSASGAGQWLTTGASSFTLGYVEFYLARHGAPTANITGAVYASNNTVPTEPYNALAYSDNQHNSSSFPVHDTYSWYVFNFTQSAITINANSNYSFVVEVNTTDVDGANYPDVASQGAGGAHAGHNVRAVDGAWIAGGGDVQFRLYSLDDVGQDLSYSLYENFQIFGSVDKSGEYSRVSFEAVNLWDSSSFGREYGFSFLESLSLNSFHIRGIELFRNFFDSVILSSSIVEVLELSVLDLAFILFENPSLYGSIESGRELSRVLFDNVVLQSSITSVLEGVAQNLFFTLFESVNIIASISESLVQPYVLDDALLLASFAVILAFSAIGLIFLTRKE